MIHHATNETDKTNRFQKPEIQESPHSRVSARKDKRWTWQKN